MSIIIPANSAVGGGFEVANSIMLQDSRLFKTPSSSGSQRKFTFSAWIKKSDFSSGVIFSSGESDGNPNFALYFDSASRLNLYSSQGMEYRTNAVFRDSNAWMNIVFSINTASSNAGNRQIIWINGVQQTSFSTSNSIAQNTDLSINTSAYRMAVGTGVDNQDYFGGYVAEVVFLDDQALGHLSFGEFDEDSGIWKPIAITGSAATPGTNGFYLNFQDSSNLGNDEFGGTDLSVSDIVATDQKTDTCTNNFCLLNPIDKGYGTINFTEGNTQAAGSGSGWHGARATMGVSSGKWYWEVNMSGSNQMGVSNETIDMDNDNAQDLVGVTVFYNASGGIIRTDGSQVGGTTATFVLSDVAGYALDMDDKKLSIYKNGSIIVTNTALSTSITDFALPFFSVNGGGTWKVNFGNPSVALNSAVADGNGYGAFEYTPPSGYLALCTKNLSKALS